MSNLVPPPDNGESISYAEQLLLELQRRQDELADEDDEVEVTQYLTFRLADESYGLPLEKVKSVERLREVTVVPGTHEAILGVVNLKSAIVPVVDIHVLLHVGAVPPTRAARFVIIGHADAIFGLLVDSVTEVTLISQSDIEAALLTTQDSPRFILHELDLPDRLLGVLNLDAILQAVKE